MRLSLAAAVLTCSLGRAESGLILDETAYWRYYLQGGPVRISYEAMKQDANALFTKSLLKRHERTVLRELKKAGRKTDDWRKELRYPAGYLNLRLLNDVETSGPPAEWTRADFDDRDWSCYRKPFKMGKDFYLDGFVDHFYHIRTAYFRSTFEVPEPHPAGDLALHLVYRGGVRAFLNGREIARGHLPPGELEPNTPAQPYPFEAYYARKGEHAELGERWVSSWGVGEDGCLVPETRVFALRPDDYEHLKKNDKVKGPYRRVRAIGYGGRCYLTRSAWDRLVKLRDRSLRVRIPAGRLRKGTNVLALEVRTSLLHPTALRWSIPWQGVAAWKHGWLLRVRLTGEGKDLPSARTRPPGVQVWAVDVHHRLYSREFRPPGALPTRLHITGARNGTYSAQIAVGTDRPLKGLKAAVGEFRGADGRKLPASIARVLWPVGHPEWVLRTVGEGKGSPQECRPGPTRGNALVILDRYSAEPGIVGPVEDQAARDRQRLLQEKELKAIRFFDHLSAEAVGSVPAGACQPVWVSVTIPETAAPGSYRASMKIEADGLKAITLPVDLEVADWRVPDPRQFRTIMCLEQSPYAVARRYEVEPWSDEHFRRTGPSMALLGKVGNDFLAIPVLCRTEIGNAADSPLRVTRRKDGSLSLDFTRVDRYVDLAIRHWGVPRWIAFIVDHCGKTDYGQTIHVTDEATGRKELLKIGPGADAHVRRATWRALAGGICAHMKSRGLERSVYWGLHGDGVNDPSLPKLLREFAPGVTWVRWSHQYRPDETYTLCANVRGGYFLSTTSQGGWKALLSGAVNLWLPRHWNSIAACEGKSAPFAYRLGIERALSAGAPGVARIGADYWLGTWLHDFPLRPYTGMPVLSVLWPGASGAEPSVRFQMLCEGLQETEARIFLEQAVAKLDDPALKKEITALLDRRIHETLFALVSAPHIKIEEYSSGWQVRSRELYGAAARVAKRLGVDLDRGRLAATIPARGKMRVKVNLRNWTSRPRAWKVASDQDWIQPAATAGRARPGSQDLWVTLDAARLPPGADANGTLTLTDVASGRTEPLEIAGAVSKVLTFAGQETVVNVACGGSAALAFTLLNHSAGGLDWAIDSPAPWLKASPRRGRLPSGGQSPVRLSLQPPDKARATHKLTLRISDRGGTERAQPLTVHVLPPRVERTRRPAGKAVALEGLSKALAKSCILGGRKRDLRHGVPFYKPHPDRPLSIGRKTDMDYRSVLKQYKRGMSLPPDTTVTYNLEGKQLAAFSAEVGWNSHSRRNPERREALRLHFEIYVDGKLADHSGLMGITDGPRLLTAEGLQAAREIRLVTRFHNDTRNDSQTHAYGVWGEPTFHQQP